MIPPVTRYLFIDGAYLAEVYKKLMQAFWNIDGEINFMALKGIGSANKVFYYDCVDDVVRPHEEEIDRRVRARHVSRRRRISSTAFASYRAFTFRRDVSRGHGVGGRSKLTFNSP